MSLLAGAYYPSEFCAYQAIGIQFFANAAVLWWLVLTNSFHSLVLFGNEAPASHEHLFHLFGWGLPLALTIVAKASNTLDTDFHFGMSECWISGSRVGGGGFRVFLVRSPQLFPARSRLTLSLSDSRAPPPRNAQFLYGEMALACLVGGVYIWPRCVLKLCKVHRENATFVRTHLRMLLFVILFFTVFAVLVSYRIISDSLQLQPSFTLSCVHAVCVSSTGIYSFAVFGASQSNLDLWRRLVRRGCRLEQPQEEPLLADAERSFVLPAKDTAPAKPWRKPRIADGADVSSLAGDPLRVDDDGEDMQ